MRDPRTIDDQHGPARPDSATALARDAALDELDQLADSCLLSPPAGFAAELARLAQRTAAFVAAYGRDGATGPLLRVLAKTSDPQLATVPSDLWDVLVPLVGPGPGSHVVATARQRGLEFLHEALMPARPARRVGATPAEDRSTPLGGGASPRPAPEPPPPAGPRPPGPTV